MKQFNTKQMPKTTPGYRVAVWEQEDQVGKLHLGSYLIHGEFTDRGPETSFGLQLQQFLF